LPVKELIAQIAALFQKSSQPEMSDAGRAGLLREEQELRRRKQLKLAPLPE